MKPKPTAKKARRKAKRKPMIHAPMGSWDERQVTGEGPYKRKAKRKREDNSDILLSRKIEQEVLDILNEPTVTFGATATTPALDITMDTAKPVTDEWMGGMECRHEPIQDFQEEFDPQPSDGKVVVGIVVLSAVFVFGIILGSFVEHKRQPEPKVVTKTDTIYRNPPLNYSLAENPWAPQKLPLLPEDIEVIRNP